MKPLATSAPSIPRAWFVYVLLNNQAVTYTGIATDVAARLDKHNRGHGARFTRGRGPWRVIHIEGPLSRGDALRREIAIKSDAPFRTRLKGSLGSATFHDARSSLPVAAGAYVLMVTLAAPLAVKLGRRAPIEVAPGRYLYCGSAKAGLRGRVGRHLNPEKRRHWHIDQVTGAGRVLGAWVLPGGQECALMTTLASLPQPIRGFGSSDCRICRSHLLAWPGSPESDAQWISAVGLMLGGAFPPAPGR